MSPPAWTLADTAAGVFGGFLGAVLIIFLFVLSVLWIVLPFAVFGIKKRLDRVVLLQEEQTEVLRSIRDGRGDPHP